MSWSVVQSASVPAVGGTLLNNMTVTLGSNVSASSTLLLFVQGNVSGGGVITFDAQDSLGNAFRLIGTVEDGFDSTVVGVFALSVNDAGVAGTKPVVHVFINGSDEGSLLLQEVSGTSIFADGTMAVAANLDGGNSISSAAYSSSTSNEYLVAVYVTDATMTWTAPSGWTTDPNSINGNSNGGNLGVFYKDSSGGAESATVGQSTTDIISQLAIIAFQPPQTTKYYSAFGQYGNGDAGVFQSDWSSWGDMQLGLGFKVTQPKYQLNGYYFWCTSAETSTVTLYGMCLFEYSGGTEAVVSGSKVNWSGTLTAGWNYLALPTPIQLTANTPYTVVSAANGGFYYRNNVFGSGGFLPNGIINGPLTVYSDASGSRPNPSGNPQGSYNTASTTDPTANFPTNGYDSGQPFIDILVTAVPVSSGTLLALYP